MPERSLDELKRVITQEYLGTRGIHGVGIRRRTNAVALYVDRELDRELVDELTELARPMAIEVIRQDRADIKKESR